MPYCVLKCAGLPSLDCIAALDWAGLREFLATWRGSDILLTATACR